MTIVINVRFVVSDLVYVRYDVDRPEGIFSEVYVCPVQGEIWARIIRPGAQIYCVREVAEFPQPSRYARYGFALPGCLLPHGDAYDWPERLSELPDPLLSREFLNQTDPLNMENSPIPPTALDVMQTIATLRMRIHSGEATLEEKTEALKLLRGARLSAAHASASSKAKTVKPKIDGDALLSQLLG